MLLTLTGCEVRRRGGSFSGNSASLMLALSELHSDGSGGVSKVNSYLAGVGIKTWFAIKSDWTLYFEVFRRCLCAVSIDEQFWFQVAFLSVSCTGITLFNPC